MSLKTSGASFSPRRARRGGSKSIGSCGVELATDSSTEARNSDFRDTAGRGSAADKMSVIELAPSIAVVRLSLDLLAQIDDGGPTSKHRRGCSAAPSSFPSIGGHDRYP